MSKDIKCVVWDLDNTIWDGVLTESDDIQLKPGIKEIIKTLDSKGVLHSIASKNNFNEAMDKLREFKLDKYFLYPQIGWNAKSVSISNIQKSLNIGIDTLLFCDDQEFEREEVKSVHNGVMCVDANEYASLVKHPRLNPRFVTEDSKHRREMYLADIKRNELEESYEGPKESFLASLKMEFIISKAKETDLARAEELTIRTNQLNTTGITYNYEELDQLRLSGNHKLLVCELTDKYGSYGKIGLALIEVSERYWHIKLLLMSCRVITRGIGTILLSYIMNETKKENKTLLADFKKTDRNKMMYVSYRFANFKEKSANEEGQILFENDLSQIQKFPPYINIKLIE